MTMDIPSFVKAAGGEIVGKVRLQKMVYLLDRLGLDTGFGFDYHHYGPYSDDLADAVEEAVVFGRLDAEQKRRQADGVPFVVFSLPSNTSDRTVASEFDDPRVTYAINAMQRRSAMILELAATIDWLDTVEDVPDWRGELIRRKGVKAENRRVEAALDLLRELKLSPS